MDYLPLIQRELIKFSEEQISHITLENIHVKDNGFFDLSKSSNIIQNNEGRKVYAVDLGGDKIESQIFRVNDGQIEGVNKPHVNKGHQGYGYMSFLENTADEAFQKNIPVGLSIAGPLEGTRLHVGPNIKAFGDEFEAMYRSDFAKLFDHPSVDNDAVAGLKAGAVKALKKFNNIKNVLYIISGSGFGAALLKNGAIMALEPGHIELADDLNKFNIKSVCGVFGNNKPCIEKIASGKAGIEASYENIAGISLSGQEISELAKNGDELANNLYDLAACSISNVVKGLSNIFNLQKNKKETVVIFHGGVFNAYNFTQRLEQYLNRDLGLSLQKIFTKDVSRNVCLEGAAIGALINSSKQF